MATVKQTIGEHDVGRDESAAAGDSGRGTLEGPGATVGTPSPPSGAHRRGCGGAQALEIAEHLRPAKKPPGLATPALGS